MTNAPTIQEQLRDAKDGWSGDAACVDYKIASQAADLIDRLEARVKVNETALHDVNRELSALVVDPANPDWMPALGNKNPADAECLSAALLVARTALSEGGE